MVRYLVFFGYLGTKFSGMQKQQSLGLRCPRIITVSDVMESGLKRLNIRNIPSVVASSRTDAGVHALCSTAHFDLHHEAPGSYHHPDSVTLLLNDYCARSGQDIRVLRTLIVPESFSSRYKARRRTYVYRLAVLRSVPRYAVTNPPKGAITATLTPLVETNMSYLLSPPFDHTAMVRASRYFRGLHNFSTFMKPEKPSNKSLPRNPVRYMEVADVSPGRGVLCEHDKWQKDIEFWDITFASSGFLYRQVRRMVAALIAVANGRITEKDIVEMLHNPNPYNYHKAIRPVPAHGLFLKSVDYNDEDLLLPPDYFDVIVKCKQSYTLKTIIEYQRLFNHLHVRAANLGGQTPTSN